jgi:anti-sigma factor RsiW
MNCRAVERHLLAYRAGEGHPALRRRIARHLHECDRCYARYQSDQALEPEMRRALSSPPPGDFGRVWRGIQRDLAQPTPAASPMRYALALTALLLMLLLPMTFGSGGIAWATPPTPPSPRSGADLEGLERATPSPASSAMNTLVARAETPASTPDAPYRTESLSVISITTP